jgi:hypothetical protein
MIQVWATYSVMDHLEPKAFVADVMLYDRLIIPVPAEDDLERWKGWNVERQAQLLEILGDRAEAVVWDKEWREKWKTQLMAAKAFMGDDMLSQTAFRMTPHTLLEKVFQGRVGSRRGCRT